MIENNDTQKVSLWAKEELPTWAEIYHDFYIPRLTKYRAEYDKDLDPYWNIPKKKLILAQMCNQLNKLIHEDKVDISSYLRINDLSNVKDIIFYLFDGGRSIGDDYSQFPIYTWKLPSTGAHSIFITNEYPRVDIEELYDTINLQTKYIFQDNSTAFKEISFQLIEILLKDVITYFEDEPGWKDDNGNIIEMHTCQCASPDSAS